MSGCGETGHDTGGSRRSTGNYENVAMRTAISRGIPPEVGSSTWARDLGYEV